MVEDIVAIEEEVVADVVAVAKAGVEVLEDVATGDVGKLVADLEKDAMGVVRTVRGSRVGSGG